MNINTVEYFAKIQGKKDMRNSFGEGGKADGKTELKMFRLLRKQSSPYDNIISTIYSRRCDVPKPKTRLIYDYCTKKENLVKYFKEQFAFRNKW